MNVHFIFNLLNIVCLELMIILLLVHVKNVYKVMEYLINKNFNHIYHKQIKN